MLPMPERQPCAPSGPIALLVILILGTLCFGMQLGTAELDKEEARRAIPAREMLASGEFVVPTIWQRTYLAKPPLLFWTIAAIGEARGQVDEVAARLPSVLATILTAIALLALAGHVFGRRTGFVAAVMWLISPGTFEKGALGELEATLAFYVFAAIASLWLALEPAATRARSNVFTGTATLALAAATMTKGPVALLFYAAAVLGLAWARRRPGILRRPACWLPMLAAVTAVGVWAALVMLRVDADQAVSVWAGEIARTKDLGIGNYFKDRRDLLIGVPAAFLPGSWLCIVALFSRRRTPASTPATTASAEQAIFTRFAALAIGFSLAFFLVQPGVRTRFCYPALPVCTLLGAHLLVRAIETGQAMRSIRLLVLIVVGLGIALVAGGIALHATDIQGIHAFDTLGHFLLAILAVAIAWTVARVRKPMTLSMLLGPLMILVTTRLVQTTQLVPQLEAAAPKHAFGSELDRIVPEGQSIDLRFWKYFNELSYCNRKLIHAEPDQPLGSSRYVLALPEQLDTLNRQPDHELVERAKLRVLKGAEVLLLEVR